MEKKTKLGAESMFPTTQVDMTRRGQIIEKQVGGMPIRLHMITEIAKSMVGNDEMMKHLIRAKLDGDMTEQTPESVIAKFSVGLVDEILNLEK